MNNLDPRLEGRLRNEKAYDLIMTAEEAAMLINDGDAVGISGFTNSGYAKAVPVALSERVKKFT